MHADGPDRAQAGERRQIGLDGEEGVPVTADVDRSTVRQAFGKFVTDEAELDAVFRGEPILAVVSIDSLAVVHLVTELEKEFGVRFDHETIEQAFENIDTLTAFLGGASEGDAG